MLRRVDLKCIPTAALWQIQISQNWSCLYINYVKEVIVFDTMWKFIFIISLPQTVQHNVTVKNMCKFIHCNQGLGRISTTLKTEAEISETFLTAVAQWLRCCATNRKVAGSIPAGVSGFFIDIKSFRSHHGPGVESASHWNDYQEYFLRVKAVGA